MKEHKNQIKALAVIGAFVLFVYAAEVGQVVVQDFAQGFNQSPVQNMAGCATSGSMPVTSHAFCAVRVHGKYIHDKMPCGTFSIGKSSVAAICQSPCCAFASGTSSKSAMQMAQQMGMKMIEKLMDKLMKGGGGGGGGGSQPQGQPVQTGGVDLTDGIGGDTSSTTDDIINSIFDDEVNTDDGESTDDSSTTTAETNDDDNSDQGSGNDTQEVSSSPDVIAPINQTITPATNGIAQQNGDVVVRGELQKEKLYTEELYKDKNDVYEGDKIQEKKDDKLTLTELENGAKKSVSNDELKFPKPTYTSVAFNRPNITPSASGDINPFGSSSDIDPDLLVKPKESFMQYITRKILELLHLRSKSEPTSGIQIQQKLTAENSAVFGFSIEQSAATAAGWGDSASMYAPKTKSYNSDSSSKELKNKLSIDTCLPGTKTHTVHISNIDKKTLEPKYHDGLIDRYPEGQTGKCDVIICFDFEAGDGNKCHNLSNTKEKFNSIGNSCGLSTGSLDISCITRRFATSGLFTTEQADKLMDAVSSDKLNQFSNALGNQRQNIVSGMGSDFGGFVQGLPGPFKKIATQLFGNMESMTDKALQQAPGVISGGVNNGISFDTERQIQINPTERDRAQSNTDWFGDGVVVGVQPTNLYNSDNEINGLAESEKNDSLARTRTQAQQYRPVTTDNTYTQRHSFSNETNRSNNVRVAGEDWRTEQRRLDNYDNNPADQKPIIKNTSGSFLNSDSIKNLFGGGPISGLFGGGSSSFGGISSIFSRLGGLFGGGSGGGSSSSRSVNNRNNQQHTPNNTHQTQNNSIKRVKPTLSCGSGNSVDYNATTTIAWSCNSTDAGHYINSGKSKGLGFETQEKRSGFVDIQAKKRVYGVVCDGATTFCELEINYPKLIIKVEEKDDNNKLFWVGNDIKDETCVLTSVPDIIKKEKLKTRGELEIPEIEQETKLIFTCKTNRGKTIQKQVVVDVKE